MKNFFILLSVFAFFSSNMLQAQKIVQKTLKYQSGQRIHFDLPIGENIQISGWDKNEVSLEATVNINNNQLNDVYQLEVDEGSQAITFQASFDEKQMKKGKAEDCCCDQGSHYSSGKDRISICPEISYVLKVPRGAAIDLETINADVEAKDLEGDNQIKSISGFIDFSWPKKRDARLELKSVTGELYTDLDFEVLNKKKSAPIVGYTLKGKLGQEGPLLDLETVSSNIYLRGQ